MLSTLLDLFGVIRMQVKVEIDEREKVESIT